MCCEKGHSNNKQIENDAIGISNNGVTAALLFYSFDKYNRVTDPGGGWHMWEKGAQTGTTTQAEKEK